MTGELRKMAFFKAERVLLKPSVKGEPHGIRNKTLETCGRVSGATWSAGMNEPGGDGEPSQPQC